MINEAEQKYSQVHTHKKIAPYFFGNVEMQFGHLFNLVGYYLANSCTSLCKDTQPE